MTAPARSWLIDKSALVRLGDSPERDLWRDRIERGLVRITTVTLLEVAYSARNRDDMARLLHTAPLADMPVEPMTFLSEVRAVALIEELALRGQHRAPSIPDVLIAAVAEKARLVVLHVDKDFELIADVTGQPVERLATTT